MRRIKWIGLSFMCLVLLLMPLRTQAATGALYTNPETGYSAYIEDEYDLLTDEEEAKLLEVMKPITEYGNVLFLSHNHANSNSDAYSGTVYHQYFGTASGTMFAIDMYNRNITVFSDGAIYLQVTKQYALTITDNVYRYATRGDYYTCAANAFEQEAQLLKNGHIFQPMKVVCTILLALILGILINYFILKINRRSLRSAGSDGKEAKDRAFPVLVSSAMVSGVLLRSYHRSSDSGGGGGSSGGGGGGGGGGSSGGGGSHGF